MSADRAAMDAALKAVVVPVLRAKGWTGGLPHFRRITTDRADFLTVQYARAGGAFCVELVSSGPDGLTEGPHRDRPVGKLTASHFNPFGRLRLGADPDVGVNDHWYSFGPPHSDLRPLGGAPEELAAQLLADYDRQVEDWLHNDGSWRA